MRQLVSNQSSTTRILGIDPGTATVGYGVIDCLPANSYECVAAGIIQTSKDLCPGERLRIIRNDLLTLIDEYAPHVLALEAIFFFKNAKTLVPVAQARGVILEAAASAGIAAYEYTPMQVKLQLTGFGRADKQLVQLTVAKLLGHEGIFRPDDAADAIALAVCHARMSLTPAAPAQERQSATSRVLDVRT